jgi:hypothetical protein
MPVDPSGSGPSAGGRGADPSTAIANVKAAYLDHVDAQEWVALRALFTDDATIAMPGWPESLAVDAALSRYAEAMAPLETIHQVSAPVILVDAPDRARASWRMEDRLYSALPEPVGHHRLLHGFGRYDEEYRRIGGDWLIHRIALTRTRMDLHPAVRKLRTP